MENTAIQEAIENIEKLQQVQIEIEDSSSIRLYMDKELTKELIQELSNELTKLHY
jgi:hypothetical protein